MTSFLTGVKWNPSVILICLFLVLMRNYTFLCVYWPFVFHLLRTLFVLLFCLLIGLLDGLVFETFVHSRCQFFVSYIASKDFLLLCELPLHLINYFL